MALCASYLTPTAVKDQHDEDEWPKQTAAAAAAERGGGSAHSKLSAVAEQAKSATNYWQTLCSPSSQLPDAQRDAINGGYLDVSGRVVNRSFWSSWFCSTYVTPARNNNSSSSCWLTGY